MACDAWLPVQTRRLTKVDLLRDTVSRRSPDSSGTRTFFINQKTVITQTAESTYSGGNSPLAAGNAFQGSSTTSITGQVAVGTTGADGNMWRQVQ